MAFTASHWQAKVGPLSQVISSAVPGRGPVCRDPQPPAPVLTPGPGGRPGGGGGGPGLPEKSQSLAFPSLVQPKPWSLFLFLVPISSWLLCSQEHTNPQFGSEKAPKAQLLLPLSQASFSLSAALLPCSWPPISPRLQVTFSSWELTNCGIKDMVGLQVKKFQDVWG